MTTNQQRLVSAFGAAKGDISPRTPLALAGRGGPLRIASPVLHSLEVNAVVIQSEGDAAAIVAVDTLFCSAALLHAVKTNLGKTARVILGDAVFLIASHTHNAPSLDPSKPVLGPVDEAYFGHAAKTIAGTIEMAIHNAISVDTVAVGSAACKANARRRLKALRILKQPPFLTRDCFTLPNHASDVPRDFHVQIARDRDSKPLWAIWSWPCHATAYPQGNTINADFPGEVRRVLRQLLVSPELPVVFLPGFAGDLRADASPVPVPLWKRLMTPFARPFAETTIGNFNSLCDALAEASKAAVAAAVDKPLQALHMKFTTKQLSLNQLIPGTTHTGVVGLSFLSIGPLNYLMMGAETCSPWIRIISPLLPAGTMLTGYCNDVPCYLPTDAQVLEGGYEVVGWRGSFGVDGTFTTNLESKITSAVQSLLS